MKKIIVVSGGFDPIHSGHIQLLSNARALGDKLIVALNDDEWLANKKGKEFMPFNERKIVIDCKFSFDDWDRYNRSIEDGESKSQTESYHKEYIRSIKKMIDDTNKREFSRLILFLRRRRRHALFGGGGGLSKSALSFHDKTHTRRRRLLENEASFFSLFCDIPPVFRV